MLILVRLVHPSNTPWPILVSFGTILLIMTSMYLAFTPVGANRVNGAQFRYLIPLFLPVMMHIGTSSGLMKWAVKMKSWST